MEEAVDGARKGDGERRIREEGRRMEKGRGEMLERLNDISAICGRQLKAYEAQVASLVKSLREFES